MESSRITRAGDGGCCRRGSALLAVIWCLMRLRGIFGDVVAVEEGLRREVVAVLTMSAPRTASAAEEEEGGCTGMQEGVWGQFGAEIVCAAGAGS